MNEQVPSKERLECDGLIVTDAGRYVDISFEDQSIAIGTEQEAALRAWLNTRAAPEPFAHPYGDHPHQVCGCGAKVPTDVHLLHTCGDRLTPKGSAQPPCDDLKEATRLLHVVNAWFWRASDDPDSARVDPLYPARGTSCSKAPLFAAIRALLDRYPYGGATSTKHPECQHDKSKPGPTLVPLGSAAFGSSDWTWMCTVCNDRFNLPTATAQGEGSNDAT